MRTVVIINGAEMGGGDDELGRRILQTLLGKIAAVKGLEAIAFYNAGVKLVSAGSLVLPQLKALEEAGVDLVACGTCIDHFGLGEAVRVGEIGSMDAILALIDRADKVVTI